MRPGHLDAGGRRDCHRRRRGGLGADARLYLRAVGRVPPGGRGSANLWCSECWEIAQAGGEFSAEQLALLRLTRTHAVAASVEAVDRMYTAAGGTSVYARNPLERCFRDIRTVTEHASMNPANYEISGWVLLGLP